MSLVVEAVNNSSAPQAFSGVIDSSTICRPILSAALSIYLRVTEARIFAVTAKQQPKCPEIAATNKMWDYLDSIRKTKVKRHRVRCKAYDTLMKSKAAIAESMDPTDGALFYHADYVDPWWSKHYVRTVQILNHIFYRPHTRKVAYTQK